MDRTNVNDSSPALIFHVRQHGLGKIERRRQHQGNDQFEFLGREILERADVLQASVVQKDVYSSKLAVTRLDQVLDLGLVCEISRVMDDLA